MADDNILNINKAAQAIMASKKGLQTNIELESPRKYDGRPLYQSNANDPIEIGYGRPKIPWSDAVIEKSTREKRQPLESPLKRWWLEEERKKIEQRKQNDKISSMEDKTES